MAALVYIGRFAAGTGVRAAGVGARTTGAGAGAAATTGAGRTAGAGARASSPATGVSNGFGTFARGAVGLAAATRVGAKPQSCSRLRETRGTHSVAPPIPARTNTHPRLSTYWFAVNEAGGNSAGPDVSRSACADTAPAAKAAITATVERNPDRRIDVFSKYIVDAPTRYCMTTANNAYNVKGLYPLFCAKHPVARIP